MKPKVILVLGCVRSGTSCLAGMLVDQGVSCCGLVDTKGKPNLTPKGSFEDPRVTKFHHDMFDWFNPFEASLPIFNQDSANDILKSYEGKFPILLKDPKILMVYDMWKTVLDPVCIGTFRHPTLVVDSMMRRLKHNKYYPFPKKVPGWCAMTREWAYAIWVRYNLKLIKLYEKNNFPIVNFDSPTYITDVKRAFESIGVECKKKFSMFEEKFRHTHISTEAPPIAEVLYNALKEKSV